jgi:hypothetical protein
MRELFWRRPDQRQSVGDRERMVSLRHRPAVALPSLILQGGKEAKADNSEYPDCARSVSPTTVELYVADVELVPAKLPMPARARGRMRQIRDNNSRWGRRRKVGCFDERATARMQGTCHQRPPWPPLAGSWKLPSEGVALI